MAVVCPVSLLCTQNICSVFSAVAAALLMVVGFLVRVIVIIGIGLWFL
jgi:hypothetical protein